jgi:nucleoside-diphosphate-sugar epimerase
MRVLVTGATGFIGSAFIRQALARGHDIHALVRPGRPVAALGEHPTLSVSVGTLAAPPWDDLVRFAPETCVHAAWITTADVYLESPNNDRYRDESVAFATGLFKRGVGHAVVVGTCAEYRPSPRPLDEARSPLEPRSSYARAKHELRLALGNRAGTAGARVAWARVFQPYGGGEPPARLCSTVIRRLAAGQRVTLATPGAVRDWIHVDDVATALLCLVESRAGTIVNVGSGIGRTVESIALVIGTLLGRPELIATSPAAPDPLGSLVADPARLRGLGWTPHIDLEAGLASLIEQLR